MSDSRKLGSRPQDSFWTQDYAADYVDKNSEFDNVAGKQAWSTMLSGIQLDKKHYLEIGCNIGRNIDQIKLFDPTLIPSAVEINKEALGQVLARHKLAYAECGAVQDVNLQDGLFELVFTCGVLIHIHPNDLVRVMKKMYNWSSRFILIAEYFNRTPVSIEYQGRSDMLFKRDFGSLFMDTFPVRLVDYGFLWGRVYEEAGFDDITWWMFEKQ